MCVWVMMGDSAQVYMEKVCWASMPYYCDLNSATIKTASTCGI